MSLDIVMGGKKRGKTPFCVVGRLYCCRQLLTWFTVKILWRTHHLKNLHWLLAEQRKLCLRNKIQSNRKDTTSIIRLQKTGFFHWPVISSIDNVSRSVCVPSVLLRDVVRTNATKSILSILTRTTESTWKYIWPVLNLEMTCPTNI